MCEVQAWREPLVLFAARASWTRQILTGRNSSTKCAHKSLKSGAYHKYTMFQLFLMEINVKST